MEAEKFNRLLSKLNYEKNAIDEIYKEYKPRIVIHIYIKYKDYGEEFAKDVAQEFFLRLYNNRNRLPYIERPASWIYAACENIANRKLKKFDLTETSFEDIPPKQFEEISTDKMELFIDLEQIQDVFLKLSDNERTVIFDVFWLGYSLKELSPMMDIKYDNMRQKYRRILSKIRKLL